MNTKPLSLLDNIPSEEVRRMLLSFFEDDEMAALKQFIEVVDLEVKKEWISVKDRLPKVIEDRASKQVLVAVECAKYETVKNPDGLFELKRYEEGYDILGVAQWRENGVEHYWSNSDLPCSLTDITHWQELPLPPTKEQV